MLNTQSLSAILYIISNWIIWAVLFTGIGLFFAHIFKYSKFFNKVSGIFYAFWTGYAFLIFILMLEHYFISMNYYALIAPILMSFLGFILQRKYLCLISNKLLSYFSSQLITFCLLSITTIAYACYATLGPVIFDTGKYHLQAITWYAQAPVTFGLGNLCPYFAYNNSNFLLAGLMEGTTLSQQSFHSMNTLLVLAFFMHICLIVIRNMTNKINFKLSDLFILLYAILMFAFIFGKSRSITPAISIDICCAYIMKLLIKLSSCQNKSRFRYLYSLLIPLCALVFTVKLSYAVQTCFVVIIALVFCLRNFKSWALLKRYFIISVIFFTLFFSAWLGRNIIMTGHLIFPMNSTRFNLEWSVPADAAHKVYADFKTWGRGFDVGNTNDNINRTKFLVRNDAWKLPLFSMEWISVWFKLVWYNLYIWFAAIIVFITILFWRRNYFDNLSLFLLSLPWFAGAIALFVTAPTIRFLRASLFIFAAFSFALLIFRIKPFHKICQKLCVLLPLVIIIMGIIYYKKGVEGKEYYRGEMIDGFENAPQPKIKKDATKIIDGIEFNIIHGSLWYAPLNSQAPDNLRLLEPSNLKGGFKTQTSK